jgi:hypothetical protein
MPTDFMVGGSLESSSLQGILLVSESGVSVVNEIEIDRLLAVQLLVTA